MDAVTAGLLANVISDAISALGGWAAQRDWYGNPEDPGLTPSELETLVRGHAGSGAGRSLVASLVLLHLESETPSAETIEEVRDAYLAELEKESSDLSLPADTARATAQHAWQLLSSYVEQAVSGTPAGSRLELRTSRNPAATSARLVPVEAQRVNSRMTAHLPLAVRERVLLAYDAERRRRALTTVDLIRAAAETKYSFLFMPHAKATRNDIPIEDLYVDRDLTPYSVESPSAWQPLTRVVVLGTPGCGKSTFVRKQLHDALVMSEAAPLLVELREVQLDANRPALTAWIHAQLTKQLQITVSHESLEDALTLGCARLVFDGIDELIDLSRRQEVVEAIEAFCLRYPFVPVITTSRELGFAEARPRPSARFSVYMLPEFDDQQVSEYIEKWFTVQREPESAPEFRRESWHAEELLCNPLMLSLLCSLYQYVGYIPENRPEVFEQCSELLFQRWDKVKRVPIPLRLGVRSRHLLEDLADFIFRNQAVQSGVQERQLRQMLTAQIRLGRTIEAEEAEDEAQAFLDYCAGRAWLLTQVSTVKGQRMFGFTHRTFLEYFAGRRIARLAESPEELVQALGPIILGVSSEVVPQIALQEFDANSNFGGDSALRLLVFTSRTLTHRANENFLQFAAECLEFGLALPQTAADIIRTILIGFERRSGARQLGDALFRGGDQAYRVIRNLIREEPSKELLIGALRLAAWSPGRAEAVTADWASVFDEATDALRITDLEIWREDEYLATLWYTERRISASDVLAAHGPGATLAANAVPGLSFESDLIRALREGASSPDRDAYLADLELVCSALEEDEATASLYAWEAVATAAKDLNTSSCTGAELFLVLCAALGLTERTYAAAGGVQSRLAGVLGVTVEAMDSHRDYIINRRDYDRDDWARLEPIPAVIGSALHDWQLPASRVNAVLRWLNADRRFVS